jgi:phosphatidylglycerol:prolipoprotein diacylglycerol transferase
MITISIDPVIFSIGHFMVRWYSVIVVTAIAAGVWLAAREAERKGFRKDDIYDSALLTLPVIVRTVRRAHLNVQEPVC